MKKIKAVALFSTAILATASTGVYADELISDGTTSPSTEQVTPSTAPSSEVVIPDPLLSINTPCVEAMICPSLLNVVSVKTLFAIFCTGPGCAMMPDMLMIMAAMMMYSLFIYF